MCACNARRRRATTSAAAVASLSLLVAAVWLASAKEEDPRRCGNTEGAICCQSWGNSCVDNKLTCCNGTCIAAPYNVTFPQAACGVQAPPLCSFASLLQKTTKFNAANAWVMTVLSTAVYPYPYAQDEKDDAAVGAGFKTWASGYGITNATFLNGQSKRHEVDTEGVCMRDDAGNVFVVFRGTSSAADAATDADVIGSLTPSHDKMFGGKGVALHDGFSDAYKVVRDATKDCVSRHMDHFAQQRAEALHNADAPQRNASAPPPSSHQPMLWVGGHSLGAALATLAATDLAQLGFSPVVYTIGSPRVGDKDYQQLYDVELRLKNQTFRLVNKNDPVARVPVTALGYRHVGTRVDVNATRGRCIVGGPDKDCEPGLCVVSHHYTDEYLNGTYACVEADSTIDLKRCPQKQLLTPINYDLYAADPGQGTLANDSLANWTAPDSSKSGAGSAAGTAASRGALLAAAAAVALLLVL